MFITPIPHLHLSYSLRPVRVQHPVVDDLPSHGGHGDQVIRVRLLKLLEERDLQIFIKETYALFLKIFSEFYFFGR